MASQFPGNYTPPPPPYQPGPPSAGLVDRVKNIIVTPKTEWPRIDHEPATVQGLFTNYAMPLAAIGPVAGLIASAVFVRYGIVAALIGAVLQFVMAVAGAFVISLIINALAPSFGGAKNGVQAAKVAVYAQTPGWIAGILNIVPGLGLIGTLAGLYGLYLLWLGLPLLMRVPEDKKVGYFVVVLIASLVVFFIFAMIVAAVIGAVLLATAAATTGPVMILR